MIQAIGIFCNDQYLIDCEFSISQFIESILCLWMAREDFQILFTASAIMLTGCWVISCINCIN